MNRNAFIFFLLFTFSRSFSQNTQGFFLTGQKERNAIIPASITGKLSDVPADVIAEIDFSNVIAEVSGYIYGNNSNQWMGQIVTEPALLSQIKTLDPHIIRFPGGNFSNIYFWDAEFGKKPADVPDTILYGDSRPVRSSSFGYGKNNTSRALSLKNYYMLLAATNSTGTICVNAGYARYGLSKDPITNAAHYAANWVRFDNGRTKFWEVGNEDYGVWQPGYKIDTTKNKDGQPVITSGALYGKIFKIFSDSMKQAAKEIHSQIYIGATIIEAQKNKPHDKEVDKKWNSGFFKIAGNKADFFVVHSYYTPYDQNSSPEIILNSATEVTNSIMTYLEKMVEENKVQMKPVALTEWNIFAVGSKQQTSFINAMHAALVLGELAKNKYGMACRWDLANAYNNGNDHGMFSQGEEPGVPKWSARPQFYSMYYFQRFFGSKLLFSSVEGNNSIYCYASSFNSGQVGVVLVNTDTSIHTVKVKMKNFNTGEKYYTYLLTGGYDNGRFSQKVFINGIGPSLPAGGPENFEKIKAFSFDAHNEIKIQMPAMSTVYVLIENEKNRNKGNN